MVALAVYKWFGFQWQEFFSFAGNLPMYFLACFACGFLINVRRTETLLWRCVRDWNKWRGVSLPGMDVSIV
jgi:hypothetical protein